ncbi:MAG: phosphatidate cytidylyltransferase [Novosphingobium sp.]|jgi:phosphatidate cytidylyltransferase|nr:phosphatidate cytidylyltransferase [Novosphingobium sp.]
MAGAEAQVRKSDLGVRTVSAAVMLAVAGAALRLGGWPWTAFVALVAAGVLWEWLVLVRGVARSPVARGLWNAGGIVYVGLAAFMLILLRFGARGSGELMTIIAAVIATDIFAYFSGRTFGGPRIAPGISPSKTWAGLIGGMAGAGALMVLVSYSRYRSDQDWFAAQGADAVLHGPITFEWLPALAVGAGIAVVAQTGDFFESWMKRKAGVKDSGRLIPGHGGLFDRVDGLLAVLFVFGGLMLAGLVV